MISPTDCTLLNLNRDCLLEIFSHLSLVDQLKFTLFCEYFNDIIVECFKSKTLLAYEFRQNFNLDEIKHILIHFGPTVVHLNINELIDETNIRFYKLLRTFCTHVKSIELFYPSSKGIQLYKDLLLKNLNWIEKFTLHTFTRVSDPNDFQKYEDKLMNIIVNMKNLKSLHLEGLTDITGQHFHYLENLVDLNVEACMNFESQYFLQICQSAIQLETLNIMNCVHLKDFEMEVLVEKQRNIINITISNISSGYEKVAKFEKLRKLSVWQLDHIQSLDNFFQDLVVNHQHNLESLRILCGYHRSCKLDPYHKSILLFSNLQELFLPDYKTYDDNYLTKISQHLPKLKTLRLYCGKESNITCKGILLISTTLTYLQELVLYPNYNLDLELMKCIHSTRKRLKCIELTIYLEIDEIMREILQSTEYRSFVDRLNVKPYLKRHLDKGLWRI